MAPSPDWGHGNVTANLVTLIGGYARTKKLGVSFADNLDVHFPDGSLFRPDFIFVSAANEELYLDKKYMTLHGVPDMVAEIFSRSTIFVKCCLPTADRIFGRSEQSWQATKFI